MKERGKIGNEGKRSVSCISMRENTHVKENDLKKGGERGRKRERMGASFNKKVKMLACKNQNMLFQKTRAQINKT